MVVRLALTALLCLSGLGAALATPARIIILRHGEKATAYKLCDIGRERAQALTTTYLGRGAAKSLFASGEAPAAILAITLHTLELGSPSAASWGEPVTLYSVLPDKDADEAKRPSCSTVRRFILNIRNPRDEILTLTRLIDRL